MKNLKFLIIILFLCNSSLYSMQKLKNMKIRHAISLLSVGFVAKQYTNKFESYNDFLSTKNEWNLDRKFYYREKLSDDLTIESHTELVVPTSNYRNRKPKYHGVKKLNKENERSNVAEIIFKVKKRNKSQNCECYVSLLETKYEYRNNGYATLLLENLEKEMQESNCSRISLSAVENKMPFYKKRGFRVVTNRYSRNLGCIRMEKELPETK
jgi:GNAT superfamily N-acetyltransferase